MSVFAISNNWLGTPLFVFVPSTVGSNQIRRITPVYLRLVNQLFALTFSGSLAKYMDFTQLADYCQVGCGCCA
jgi:hypothetical protein